MNAQIYEVFRQGFETGEATNYTVTSGTATPQTAFVYGGSRAIKMDHVQGNQTVIELDEIDMSGYASLSYFTLEFAHINNVSPYNTASSEQVAMIEAKLASSTTWTRLTSTYYDKSGSYSSYFDGSGYFCSEAYSEWGGSTMDATWWKNERFNLDRMFNNVNAANRKLNIRITLFPKTSSVGGSNQGWFLDDIVVRASSQAIVKPVITMVKYPDLVNHPSSRGAQVTIDAKAGNTSLSINPDSVYMLYRIGSSSTVHKVTMNPVAGINNRYTYRIPFEGYDTMMYFRIVVKDASSNENTQTMPRSEVSWFEYKCIRGQEHTGYITDNATQTLTDFPFPSDAAAKSEFIIDSATLANAGFGPGAISSISFIIKSGLQGAAQTRNDMQIRMKNALTTCVSSPTFAYTSDYLHTVYAGNINFPVTVNNQPFTVQLQDTFFYAGKDLIIQVIQNNGSNLAGNIGVAGFACASNTKKTLYCHYDEFMGYNPYTATEFRTALADATTRPNVSFVAQKNPMLIYDCGVSAISYPSETSSASANTNQQVRVVLKNYGVATMNAVRIGYKVDDGAPVYYNWTGNLASNATTNVTLSTTQQFSAGFHTLVAWVDDTITAGSLRVRDHEPYNDTAVCEFIACAGPMSGTRQIGGTNADFGTIREFLLSLSSCGISGGLTVKLAPGTYPAFTVPSFSGASASSYLTFEPLSGTVVIEDSLPAAAAVVSMPSASYTRFRNITFRSDAGAQTSTYLVQLGSTSTGCQFENCTFTNGATPSSALLASANANNITVTGCTFNGGTIGVDLSGMSVSQRSSGNKVKKSTFNGQNTYGVYVYNQNGAEIDSNYFNDINTSAGYAVLLQNAYGATKVVRNKIYTSHGAAAIGAATVTGASSGYAVIANNMIVSEDDGTAISIVSPLNIQSASYTKVVYNSVKFTAADRSDIAAVSFGGVSLSNSYFQNNIVSVFDNTNYALNYVPGSATSNTVNANVYYAMGTALNRYGSRYYNTIAAWRAAVSSDVASQKVNPGFLNGSQVDLRSFNQSLKNIAVNVPEVTTDMFGTSRSTSPCVGAFQFDALYYDFEIVGLDEPFSQYCGNATNIPLRVKIYNWGTTTFVPSASNVIRLVYHYGNITDSVALTTSLVAGDTTDVTTTAHLNLPANGTRDALYSIKMWTSCSQDPNNTNDTSIYSVRSNYVSPAPGNVNQNVTYQNPAVITPTTGVTNWPVNGYNSGLTMPSTLYWYESATSDSVLWHGNTFTSDPLLHDTNFYFRQQRELPIIRISEVAFDNNYASTTSTVEGSTTPRPVWYNTATKVAVELTNVGDYPADLFGDTIKFYCTNANNSNNSTFNNKVYRIPSHVIIQPGASVVIQYKSGVATTDSTITFPSTINLTSNALGTLNFGVVYRHGGMAVDAVATNNMTPATMGISSQPYLWSGTGIVTTADNAGISRIGWPANPASAPSNSRQYWRAATNAHPMTMGTTNPDIILYANNGCESPRATAHVDITGTPTIDLAVETDSIASGCGLGNEVITARISNYGIQNCASATVKYSVNGVLAQSQTLTNIAPGATVSHTFSTPVNMHQNNDATFVIKVYVDRNSSEAASTKANDTASFTVLSKRTPNAPSITPVTGNYAQTANLTAASPNPTDRFIWYSRQGVALDTTTGSFTSQRLYANDTFYVSAVSVSPVLVTVGDGTSQSASSASDHAAPYNIQKKCYKAQYIYTASDLIEAGVQPGPITSLAFNLSSYQPTTSTTYNYFTISMGTTPNATFTSTTDWQSGLTQVYSSINYSVNTPTGWKTHQFSTPFEWDGTSNIVIQVCHGVSASTNKTVKTYYTSVTNTVLANSSDNTSMYTSTAAGTRSGNRPNIRLSNSVYTCEGPRTTYPVDVTGVPSIDAALAWDDAASATYSSCAPTALNVRVRNQGSTNLSAYSIDLNVDGTNVNTFNGTTTIVAGDSLNIALPAYQFAPGRHQVSATISVTGDTINANNAVSKVIPFSFCGGTYTIGPNAQFASMAAAIDTLNMVGMEGSVVFNIASGTYNGQAMVGAIAGADSAHTVTFQSATGNAADVVLTAVPTTTDNYVLGLDGSSFVSFKNLTIYSKHTSGAGNNIYASALSLKNCSNVVVDGCIIRVKNTSSLSQNANAIVIGDSVSNCSFTNNTIDSGYYAITTKATIAGHNGFDTISNNTIHGFYNRGINLFNTNDMVITQNRIESGATADSKALYGIYMSGHTGLLSLEQNQIYLVDAYTGGKRGISLYNIAGTSARRAKVYNNMVSCYGVGKAVVVPMGIVVDSASTYLNLYFNSVSVYASARGNGASEPTCRAISIGDKVDNVTNINLRDNVMSNLSAGYSLYAKTAIAIPSIDFNVYYSAPHSTNQANRKFAFWGADVADLAALRAATNADQHSIEEEPVFVGSDDLHMASGQFSALAEYLALVPEDVDGNIRPQIPTPTIGAHEYAREQHDMVILQVIEPMMKMGSNDHPTIEGKRMRVIVKIFNNGLNNESGATWKATLNGYPSITTGTRPIVGASGTYLAPREYFYDTAYMQAQLGIVDTQFVNVHLTCNGDVDLSNNDTNVMIYLDPAYDLAMMNVTAQSGCAPLNTNSQITVTVKNVGLDTIPSSMPLEFGFTVFDNNNRANFSTFSNHVTEIDTLPSFLPPNSQVTLTLTNRANFYPTGKDTNMMQIRIKAWVHCQYDLYPNNIGTQVHRDTNTTGNLNSYYTPQAPVGIDNHIPYATWDTVWASQINAEAGTEPANKPIEWYRDSNNLASRFNNKSNYTLSKQWNDGPQYFADSTYYLRYITSKGCVSPFSQVHVFVNPLVPKDAAVQQVVNPRPSGTVFAEDDTVKVRIINYGSQPITSVPVTYQFSSNNGTLLQQVTETCNATIAPGQTYDFAFDSLLQIPTPVQAASYKLRAWTDLSGEQVRLNDTIRTIHTFWSQGANGNYNYSTWNVATEGLDITRVALNSLNNELFPLGYGYHNYGPDYHEPNLHLIRGMQDTLFIACESNNGGDDRNGGGSGTLGVWIDFDRSGSFDLDSTNSCEWVAYTNLSSGNEIAIPINVPDSAWFGPMRMRIALVADPGKLLPDCLAVTAQGNTTFTNTISNGAVHDYMLYVDQQAPAHDIALTHFIGRSRAVNDSTWAFEHTLDHRMDSVPYKIYFNMANKGSDPLTSVAIQYSFIGPDTTISDMINWTGMLQGGRSTMVEVPAHRFPEGTTELVLRANSIGDVDTTNNELRKEYHRYHIIVLEYLDSLEDINYWYAPKGYTEYTRNVWELGTPAKESLGGALPARSGNNVWATDLNRNINSGIYGNYSVLYSPIFDIHDIRPDTLTFYLKKAMSAGSCLKMQFIDYQGQWRDLDKYLDTMTTWYGDDADDAFYGSSNGRWVQRMIRLNHFVGDFPQRAQFRFIYKANPTTANGGYGGGVAIDDLRIGRAQRGVDVGVVDIIEPVNPRFGETTYPKVVIKNYGYETRTTIGVAYRPHGSHLAKSGTWTGRLEPGDTCHYKFDSPFIISADFPDTFDIVAYTTMGPDLYHDNDSASRSFSLSPLEHDLSVQQFVSPLPRVVAGDSLDITVRIRNFGLDPMDNIQMHYKFNNGAVITEDVDFTQLVGDEGLPSMEYFNYTFHHRVRASLGYMTLTAWGTYAEDIYPYNDTIDMSLEGITSIKDIAVVGMVVDQGEHNATRVGIELENRGARSANDFEVVFWIDNDTTTLFRETFHRDMPFASLGHTTWMFDTILQERGSRPYDNACGYIVVPGDNDHSNDTSCTIVENYLDLVVHRVEVEENRNDQCRVRLVVENVGNKACVSAQQMVVTINGETLRGSTSTTRTPGMIYNIDVPGTVSKDRARSYVGSGKLSNPNDFITENNSTSIIKVVNYFEDIQDADPNDGMVLDQNKPNPFTDRTSIGFEIPAPGDVTFYVVDVMGRLVHRETKSYIMGHNTVEYDASQLSSGTYFYGIIFEGKRLMRKMVVK